MVDDRIRSVGQQVVFPLLVLLLLSICASLAADQLPQNRPWQNTLRSYLSTLEKEDMTIERHRFTFQDAFYRGNDINTVYRDWIVLGHLGREPKRRALRADPEHFLLTSIEEAEHIRVFPGPAAMAWWGQFGYDGNPYLNHDGVKHRALVSAIVDMMMLKTAWNEPGKIKPDFMGANLGTWAYTYEHAHDVLPESARKAFRRGMKFYLTKMERLAPRDQNSNMDMREIVTLAQLDRIFESDQMHKRLVRDARRILFGSPRRGPSTSNPRRGTFHPAGYIGEADGPETTYNGISLYHLAEAAIMTHEKSDWGAFLPEVVKRMVRFKAFNTVPEPTGRPNGPSSWSKRTNAPYPADQRDRPWRSFAEAMITDHALYRLRKQTDRLDDVYGSDGRSKMITDIKKGARRLDDASGDPGEPPVWKERHWPADLPYTWDHYIEGSYERFKKAVADDHRFLDPPFEREENFSVNFDGEFWMVKQDNWGFQVEAVPHMGRSYDAGRSGALAGGSLATFWTEETGPAILGRLPDKWDKVTWDPEEHGWTPGRWTTHHIWGQNQERNAFSSARQRTPWVHFETDRKPGQVHVTGYLAPINDSELVRTFEEPGTLTDLDNVLYRRRFTKVKNGIRLRSEVLSRGKDTIRSLWETIPVLLDNRRRSQGAETKIEFRVNETWTGASTQLKEKVKAIRIKRFDGNIRIDFQRRQKVKVTEIIRTKYQRKDNMRNIHVALMPPAKDGKPMPEKAVVEYTIRSK